MEARRMLEAVLDRVGQDPLPSVALGGLLVVALLLVALLAAQSNAHDREQARDGKLRDWLLEEFVLVTSSHFVALWAIRELADWASDADLPEDQVAAEALDRLRTITGEIEAALEPFETRHADFVAKLPLLGLRATANKLTRVRRIAKLQGEMLQTLRDVRRVLKRFEAKAAAPKGNHKRWGEPISFMGDVRRLIERWRDIDRDLLGRLTAAQKASVTAKASEHLYDAGIIEIALTLLLTGVWSESALAYRRKLKDDEEESENGWLLWSGLHPGVYRRVRIIA